MDLFTSSSDLDLSVNFSNNMNNFPRKEKISVLGKLSKVLYGHQSRLQFLSVSICCGFGILVFFV